MCIISARSAHGHRPTSPTSLLYFSYEQVPPHQYPTKYAGHPKYSLRRTLPLRRSLQLSIPAAYILCRIERVLHQLIDLRGLHAEVIRERGLEF